MKKKLLVVLSLLSTMTAASAFAGCDFVQGILGGGDKSSTESSLESSVPESESSQEPEEQDPHAEALTLAKDFVYGDLIAKDLEVKADYTLLGSYYSFFLEEDLSVSWTVDVTEGVVLSYDETNKLWNVDVDEFLTEDLFYTLTCTIADSDGHTATFTLDRKVLKAEQVVPEKITAAPVEGTAYKLYMYQAQKKNDLYFLGKMSGFYLATNNASKGEGYENAVDVFAEKVEGKDAYYLTFTYEGKKQYIGVANNWSNGSYHDNAILADSTTVAAGEVKTFEFVWSEQYGTMIATLDGVKAGKVEATTETKTDSFFLGTSGSYYTFGAMSVSEIADAYVGCLVKMVNKADVSAEDKVAGEKETLNVPTAFSGAVNEKLPTKGTTYGDVAISWAVKSGNATITDNVLTVANPSEDLTIVLTATFTCGNVTDTKDVTIVVHPKSPVTQVAADALQEGQAYTVYMYHTTNAKNYYLTGAMDGKYFGTTDDITKAAKVYIENATDGFLVYVLDANNAKSYLALEAYQQEGKSYISASVSYATTGSVFTYNSQFLTLCSKQTLASDTSKSDTFFLGTYGTYTTISASGSYYMTADKLGTEQFYATFGIIDESAIVPPAEDEPVTPPVVDELTTTPVSTIVTSAPGKYQAEGAVAAINAKSFVLYDDASRSRILVYLNTLPDVNVGDVVRVVGTTSKYGNAMQFGTDAEVEVLAQGAWNGNGIAESRDAAYLDELAAADTVIPSSYSHIRGTLAIDGKYYNVTIEGATTAIGSITYPTDEMKAVLAELNGKLINVYGLITGVTSGKYIQIVAVEVFEDEIGEDEVKPGDKEEEDDKEELPENMADFATLTTSSSYSDVLTTTNGWVINNAQVQEGGKDDANPVFSIIGEDASSKAVTLNGKTSAVGAINSPELTGGITALYFNYTKLFNDDNFSVTITIYNYADKGAEPYTYTLTKDVANEEKYTTVWTLEWVLDVPVTDIFAISIVNNCPSESTSNKDRITIWNLTWDSYEAEDVKPEEHEHEFVNGECKCGEIDPDYKPEEEKPEYEELTASVNVADYAGKNGWADATLYDSLYLDDYVTATVEGTATGDYGLNTGKYYTNGNNWRIYQSEGATLTIWVEKGITIHSVKVTYASQNNGVLLLNDEQIASDVLVEGINESFITFGITQSTATDKANGQVRITAIEVVYSGVEVEEKPDGGEDIQPDEGETECEHNYVEGVCSKCGESDPDYVDPSLPEYAPMTIAEAMAAAEGTKVEISGTVSEIYNTWNAQYGNMSVYITDGTTRIIVYRTTVVLGLGDVITVKGTITAYNNVNQIAQGSTVEITEKHVCSNYTEATCTTPATCTVCGVAKDNVLAEHNYINGECKCGAQEGVSTITASKTIAELITSEGWTSSTTKQTFKLDDVVTVKVNGGNNTGKAYEGDHIRIYATDSPAGTLTISVAEGYELVSIKVSTKTGTYAFLYVAGTSTDICNVNTVVSGTSVVLNSVKNGSDGKQVRVTAIEVVYKEV